MDAPVSPPRERSFVSPAQVVAIGLVAASIGWAMWLLRDRPTNEEVELLSGSVLPSSELAIMEAAFDRAQLTDYRTEGGRVWVPRARQSAYMRALVDAEALPREFGGSLRRALENNSPWQSRAVQSELLRVATQDELSLVICSMPGIERAAVLYDVDEDGGSGGLRGTRVKTASVSVRTQPDTDLDAARVEAIRVLVAASIAGLTPERVAVTDLRSGRVYAGPLDDTRDVAAVDPVLARRIAHERHLAAKVRQALAFVKGAIVDVSVEFASPLPAPAAPPPPEPQAPPAAPAQVIAAANAPAEVAPPAPAPPVAPPTPPPPAPVIESPAKVHVAIALPDAALKRVEVERIREHVLELLPLTPDPADRRVVITTFPAPVAPRRDAAPPVAAAVPPQAPAVNIFQAVDEPPTVTTAARDDDVRQSVVRLLRALGFAVPDDGRLPRQAWIAATSLCVGLLAAWMWWAGSRRHAAAAPPAFAPGRGQQPSIDWSRVTATGDGRTAERSERVAA